MASATHVTYLDPVTLELLASPSAVTAPPVSMDLSHTVPPPSSSHMSLVHTTNSTLSTQVVTLTGTLPLATIVSCSFNRVKAILINRTQHGSRCRISRIIMYCPRTRWRSLHSFPNFFPLKANLFISFRVRWIRRIRWIKWLQPIPKCRYETRMGYEVSCFRWYCFRRCCGGYDHGCLKRVGLDKWTIEE